MTKYLFEINKIKKIVKKWTNTRVCSGIFYAHAPKISSLSERVFRLTLLSITIIHESLREFTNRFSANGHCYLNTETYTEEIYE